MSDRRLGDGWWEASDGKWYAPELHPDYRPPAEPPPPQTPFGQPPAGAPFGQPPAGTPPGDTPYGLPPGPGVGGFDPPRYGERVGSVPPPGAGGGPTHGQFYPAVTPGKRSTGRVLAIIFGGLFLLVAGGCGVFLWSFRDQIADEIVDFSDAVTVDDPATCQVTGTDFADDYEIEATLTATSARVESHYQLRVQVTGPQGDVLGTEDTVLRSMAPSEQRTEDVFNTIPAPEPVELVTCTVTRVLRVDAD